MRRLVKALGCVGVVAGCSGPQLERLPDVEPICDGSDEARLIYTTTGGFFPFEDQFTAKYGRRYLVIDGHCDYWLGRNTVHGLSVGTIDLDRATSLASELHFGRYSTTPGARGEPCEDSGVAYLRDATGTLVDISCDGARDATFVWLAAFERVRRLSAELESEAMADWAVSSLLVLRDSSAASSRAVEWMAPFDLESIAIDYPQTAGGPGPGLAMDAATLAFVNGLRQQVLDSGLNPFLLFVHDQAERYYQLYVRDEPRPRIAAALEEVLATNW